MKAPFRQSILFVTLALIAFGLALNVMVAVKTDGAGGLKGVALLLVIGAFVLRSYRRISKGAVQ